MNDILYMVFALIAGSILGALFFGGLWLTVKKAVPSKTPALWIFSSFLLRMGITLIGFYYIASGSWQRLLVSLSGFIIARLMILQITKSIDEKQKQIEKEVGHEA